MVNIALSATVSEDGIVSVNKKYLSAVLCAGGVPSVLYPSVDTRYIEYAAMIYDGFVFCGGGDIDPKYYGEKASSKTKNICSLRDRFEYELFKKVLLKRKPILGICRGMQIMNVFLGGSLYQNIEGHMQTEPRDVRTHSVKVLKGGLLGEITGNGEMNVNSFHHQAIALLSARLCADAVSDDGYIEAFHFKDHPFLLGVQWHPEAYHMEDEAASLIFKAFVLNSEKQKMISDMLE